jgi:hypothetical protein
MRSLRFHTEKILTFVWQVAGFADGHVEVRIGATRFELATIKACRLTKVSRLAAIVGIPIAESGRLDAVRNFLSLESGTGKLACGGFSRDN